MDDNHQGYLHLVDRLNEASYAYHTLAQPIMSDYDYDLLYRQLQKLEQDHPSWVVPYSPTHRVGAIPLSKFESYPHVIKMGSLENVFNEEEAMNVYDDWVKLLKRNPELVIEPKIDGLALNLIYQKGILIHAVTRGNGIEGELVTPNAKTIKSIPLKIDDQHDFLEIRGEVYFTLAEFQALNKQQDKAGLKSFVNPRNAASGSLRQLDSSITSSRKLSFLAYVVHGHDLLENQKQSLDWLKSKGFEVANTHRLIHTRPELIEAYQRFVEMRPNLPYEIDGIVVKVNNFSEQAELGEIQRSPRWAVAWKFPAQEVMTTLERVDYQVGRLGTLTPVACLTPVFVGGAQVQHATLHNIEELERKGLMIGDKVIVRRAGDVIPEVVQSYPHMRNGQEKICPVPEVCPSCETPLSRKEAFLVCMNSICCPEQRILQLAHFASKDAMDIEGLSVQTVKKLFEAKLVSQPADFYKLTEKDLMTIEGFAEKSAQKLVAMIQQKKQATPDKLLWSLGIRHIGAITARKIFEHFTWDQFLNADRQALMSIESIGPVIADSLMDFKHHPVHQSYLQQLFEVGFTLLELTKKDGSLNGSVVVITGSFEAYSRQQLQELIKNHGGQVGSSITSKTNYLLCGSDPGSKLQQAQDKKINILNIDEFLLMLK